MITEKTIRRRVCKTFDITDEQLFNSSRTIKCSRPRFVLYYLVRKHTGASYNDIARHYGFDHTSIINGVSKIENAIRRDFKSPLESYYVNGLFEVDRYLSRNKLALERKQQDDSAINEEAVAAIEDKNIKDIIDKFLAYKAEEIAKNKGGEYDSFAYKTHEDNLKSKFKEMALIIYKDYHKRIV